MPVAGVPPICGERLLSDTKCGGVPWCLVMQKSGYTANGHWLYGDVLAGQKPVQIGYLSGYADLFARILAKQACLSDVLADLALPVADFLRCLGFGFWRQRPDFAELPLPD